MYLRAGVPGTTDTPKQNSSRFLLIGDLPPPTHGQSVSFKLLCEGLPRRGFDCRVVNLARKSESPWGRVTISRIGEILAVLARFFVGLAVGYRNIYLLITQSAAGFPRDAIMIWGAWLCRCSIVVHLHGGNYDSFYRSRSALGRFLIRHTLRRVHRIIILSERLRDMYAFDPALRDRVVVVLNSSPYSADAKCRKRTTNQSVNVLYLSGLIQSKGYRDVLDAIAILKHETSLHVEAKFAGEFSAFDDDEIAMSPAEAEAKFIRDIEANGLQTNVRYVGPVSGDEKWALFDESDFFVLPTNHQGEGQPISIIEAMAHGCVVVATNYRAIPDMVVDGITGVLVDYRQPRQIADAIRRLADDPAQYEAMSKAAARRHQTHFGIERHLDAVAAVLRNV